MRVYFHRETKKCIQIDEIKSIWSYKEHDEDEYSFISFESFDGWTYTSEKIDDYEVISILDRMYRNGFCMIEHVICYPEDYDET